MPKVHINRSIWIKATPEKVFESLIDFRQWEVWSPWLILENKPTIDHAEDGLSYQWKGNRIGEGSMHIASKTHGKEVIYDLEFLKPYRSKAKVSFALAAQEKHTQVTWRMSSSLPFFLGWMKKSLVANLNSDYNRGLSMLKDYLEKGEVPSLLEEEGVVNYPGCKYVGTTNECALEDMAGVMEQDTKELSFWVDNEELDIVGEPLTIYHKMDRVKNQCAFTVAVPVSEIPNSLPDPFHEGKIPRMKAFQLIHEGPYRHLGNAWAMLNSMIQSKEINPIKGFPPFEIYLSDPQDTADELLETAIFFPVKN